MNQNPVGSEKWIREALFALPEGTSDEDAITHVIKAAGGKLERFEARVSVLHIRGAGPFGYWKNTKE